MYFNAETQAANSAPLPLRARAARSSLPRQGRDAAQPRRALHARGPEAPVLRQGARADRPRTAPLLIGTAGHDRKRTTHAATTGCCDEALTASPLAQVVDRPRRSAGARPTSGRTTCSDLEPARLGRPFQDLELSYRPVELRVRASSRPRPSDARSGCARSSGTGRTTKQCLDVQIVPLQRGQRNRHRQPASTSAT